jgi:uncharacterized protein
MAAPEGRGGIRALLSEVEGGPRLAELLLELSPVVVALSGGVDSSVLAVVAHRLLGRVGCSVATAVSDSLRRSDLAFCRRLAASEGFVLHEVATQELLDQRYVKNGRDRCYWCRTALVEALSPLLRSLGATLVLGVTADDDEAERPGQVAARQAGARFPLKEAGLGKPQVRALAKAIGLPNWDQPASACLASRIPHGIPVRREVLSRIETAEEVLRRAGFSVVRVRDHGEIARIELGRADLEAHDCIERLRSCVASLKALGYEFVTLDLEGYVPAGRRVKLGSDRP